MSYVPRILRRDVERPSEVAAGRWLLLAYCKLSRHAALGNKIRDGIHRDCHCSKRSIGEYNDERDKFQAASGSPRKISPFFFENEGNSASKLIVCPFELFRRQLPAQLCPTCVHLILLASSRNDTEYRI